MIPPVQKRPAPFNFCHDYFMERKAYCYYLSSVNMVSIKERYALWRILSTWKRIDYPTSVGQSVLNAPAISNQEKWMMIVRTAEIKVLARITGLTSGLVSTSLNCHQQKMLGNTYRVSSLEPGDSLSAPLPSYRRNSRTVGSLQPKAYTSFFGFVFSFYNRSNETKTVLSPASV